MKVRPIKKELSAKEQFDLGLMSLQDIRRATNLGRVVEFYRREGFIKPILKGSKKWLYSPFTCQQIYYVRWLRQKGLSLKEIKVLLDIT